LGKVAFPCLICALGVDIYNEADVKIQHIEGSICQMGILCRRFPCDACQYANFGIKNEGGL